ncbi:helix-turn-helix domain-containing protein [Streptomyces triticirhizae]|uniref:XRE family transcriptional regulator n=1 Tax=Streptomyces triticirhizae TaxID=2483353 RepID=A0A3M2LQW6_9ACTN|nr:helix-turn-helix transcriptional regulator [Streptomyces triticirhizae]RMI38485.1 XRE family transcriptional regulator [Streptomyces triticirhizae]
MAKRQVNGHHDGPANEGLNYLEYLGREVRVAREGRRLSQSQLGTAVGYSKSYVSKVEVGAIIPSEKFAKGCDLVLGTNGSIERLRERLIKRGHPSWFAPFVKMEATAVEILNYSPSLIPGLLQTAEYARFLFQAWDPRATEETLAGLVKSRQDRQSVLTGSPAPELWSIIHETAFHTMVGGQEVMHRALGHLREMAGLPNVTVQVLPFSAGAPAVAEPFILLRQMDGRRTPFGDTVLGGQMSESPDQVGLLLQAYERLRAESLGVRDSLKFVERRLKDYDDQS